MSNLSTTSLPDFTDLVEKTFVKGPELIGEYAKQLFIVENLSEHTGDTRRYTEIDSETFASLKPEGSELAIASVQQGYSKTMTCRRFGKEINITWEMRHFNKYPEVTAQLVSLATFVPQRMELDLTHQITFAAAGTYTDQDGYTISVTTGDGLSTANATHTLTGGGTYSNVITGNPAYSLGSLEIAERVGNTNILSNAGDLRVMNFDTIFCANDPTVINSIKQDLSSTADSGQANPGVINVYKDKYQLIVLPYLATTAAGAYDSTKKDVWGIAAIKGVNRWQAYLGIWESPTLSNPSIGNNGEDVHTQNWTYGTTGAYGICVVSPKGFLLSTGLGV